MHRWLPYLIVVLVGALAVWRRNELRAAARAIGGAYLESALALATLYFVLTMPPLVTIGALFVAVIYRDVFETGDYIAPFALWSVPIVVLHAAQAQIAQPSWLGLFVNAYVEFFVAIAAGLALRRALARRRASA